MFLGMVHECGPSISVPRSPQIQHDDIIRSTLWEKSMSYVSDEMQVKPQERLWFDTLYTKRVLFRLKMLSTSIIITSLSSYLFMYLSIYSFIIFN